MFSVFHIEDFKLQVCCDVFRCGFTLASCAITAVKDLKLCQSGPRVPGLIIYQGCSRYIYLKDQLCPLTLLPVNSVRATGTYIRECSNFSNFEAACKCGLNQISYVITDQTPCNWLSTLCYLHFLWKYVIWEVLFFLVKFVNGCCFNVLLPREYRCKFASRLTLPRLLCCALSLSNKLMNYGHLC